MISIGNLEVTGSVYVNSGSVYATSSWAEIAMSLSGSAENAFTASYVSASRIDGNVATASFAITASYVLGASNTASYALTASYLEGGIESSSYASASLSSSYAETASYLEGGIESSSYASASISSSYSETASYLIGGTVSASWASSSVSSSYSVNSDFAITASYANNFPDVGITLQFLTASNTWSVGHNLDTEFPIVSIWQSGSNEIVQPNKIISIDANNVQVTFTIPQVGYANVAKAGSPVNPFTASSAVSSSFTATASYALSVNLPATYSQAFTASLAYTASQAYTASFVETSSYALTVDLPATYSQAETASIAVEAISSSYALSASYAPSAGGGGAYSTNFGVYYPAYNFDGSLPAGTASLQPSFTTGSVMNDINYLPRGLYTAAVNFGSFAMNPGVTSIKFELCQDDEVIGSATLFTPDHTGSMCATSTINTFIRVTGTNTSYVNLRLSEKVYRVDSDFRNRLMVQLTKI